MNSGLKLFLYVVLSVSTLVFGVLAYKNIKRGVAVREAAAVKRLDQAGEIGGSTGSAELIQTNGPAETNQVEVATNVVATNAGLAAINSVLGSTNVTAALTNLAGVGADANGATNSRIAESNGLPVKTVVAPGTASSKKIKRAAAAGELTAPKHMGLYIGLVILSVVGLGILIAYDVSTFTGNRALSVIYNDNLEGIKDPQYDEAEEVWANGNHLEAIRMMRDYLNKNPREQHVALRIAEIYEKDLGNNLAAALEYEQVLQKKLSAERWGWAAIHLCNLYFKLGHEEKAVALLKRINAEYGTTAAAEKARKRMDQMGIPTNVEEQSPESAPPAPEVTDESVPKLPPGFTLKKR